MQTGYYSTTGAMVTQFSRLDVISNNLANINTNGFKRDDVVIGDFMRLYQTKQDTLPIKDHTRDAAKFINRTLDRVPIIQEKYSDYKAGSMEQTENTLDFALSNPNAFFAISTPNGVAYTRDGSFSVDKDGYLVTKEGFRVLSYDGINNNGGIMINPSMQVHADSNGNLTFKELGNAGIGANINGGRIAVISFENPKFLQKSGNGLYVESKDANDKEKGLAGAYLNTNSNAVRQGFLEKSNVNAVIEMTNMIETNRLVDMYSKVMKTHMDDLNSEAINKLATRA